MSETPHASSPRRVLAWVWGGLRRQWMWLALWGGMIVAFVVGVYVFETGMKPSPPAWFLHPDGTFNRMWRWSTWDAVMMWCGIGGMVGVLGWGVLAARTQLTKKPLVKKLAISVLVALVLSASFAHFYGRKISRVNYAQMWDAYHYALGPKYYPELGYWEQYDCTAQALTVRQLKDKKKIHELRTYGNKTVAEARAEDCPSRFTPERWAEFERDVQLWAKMGGNRYIGRMMSDFGYNGPPFHAAVYYSIMNSFELDPTTVNVASTLDGAMIMVMLGIVCWAFGWKVGLVFALLYLTEFADRGKAIGAGIGRYPWMACLGISIAALRKQAHAIAGGFLVLATMLSVFPFLFAIGLFGRWFRVAIKERTIPRPLKRLVAGSVVSTVLCFAVAAPIAGVDEYREFFADMSLHDQGIVNPATGEQIVRQPSFGVGLKFPFLYRGQHHDHAKGVGKFEKSRQYRQIEPLVRISGWVLALIALGIAVRLEEIEAMILVGIVWFFVLFGTVHYYFTIFAFLALLYYRRYDRSSGILLLSLFWATCVIGYKVWFATDADQLVFNTVMSTVWLAYLITVMLVLGSETGWFRDVAGMIFARSPSAAEPQGPKGSTAVVESAESVESAEPVESVESAEPVESAKSADP